MECSICYVAPTYNAAFTINQTIVSIRQTAADAFQREIPIYILDGGSSDHTRYTIHALNKTFKNIYFIDKSDWHPAKRMNWFIDNCEHDVAMTFHADDIYSTPRRVQSAMHMLNEDAALCGSQVRYIQDPLDVAAEANLPYQGTHATYPLSYQDILISLNFWWSISLNTLSMDIHKIRESEVRYNYNDFKFAADYMFNFNIAEIFPVVNSSLISTITLHSGKSDGYSNLVPLYNEGQKIRQIIRSKSGLSSQLGVAMDTVLDQLCYDQAGFNGILGKNNFTTTELLCLAYKLDELKSKPGQQMLNLFSSEIAKFATSLQNT